MTENKPERISKAARFAKANKGLIYEVTDPELRSQLSYYRNQKNIIKQTDMENKLSKKISKAGEWMRDHTAPLLIIKDKTAIEALRV